jgi:hypothetical protein
MGKNKTKTNTPAKDPDSAELSNETYCFTEVQKAWLGKHYPSFLANKAKQGTKKERNAKRWVSLILLPKFLKEYHDDWSEDEVEEKADVLDAVSPLPALMFQLTH